MVTFNKITLRGNMGSDPKLHRKENGSRFVTFTLATHRVWTNLRGESRKDTQWHKIVVYDDFLVSSVTDHIRKGALVDVEGELRYRTWVDDKQQKHLIAEIVVIGGEGHVLLLGNKRPTTSYSQNTTLISTANDAGEAA